MNNQLSSISTQYRKFSKGQYVDHEQFNEFLGFFEDQDRLSRVLLQGVGIVCGFEPKLIYTNNRVSSITLSQGVAITTDGDLLTLSGKTKVKRVNDDSYASELKSIDFTSNRYTYWKPYDNEIAEYPAFYDSKKQIPLWELATATDVITGFQPLKNFGTFEDKYLLLYLETYEKEIRPCKGIDCDNHGVQLIQNLKVLVTTAEGISRIMDLDNVYPHPIFNGLIEDGRLKRVILNPVQQSSENLRLAYKNAVTQSNYMSMLNNLASISGFFGIPQLDTLDKNAFVETLEDLTDHNENFQYAYEVLKDLTDTYLEVIDTLPVAFTKAFADLNSFPKHIMLGKLGTNTGLDSTRHRFYNSPVLDIDDTDERIRLLIERFNAIIKAFRDPSDIANEKGVKVIPSKENARLGAKAIPFYYDLTKSFLDKWSFGKTKNRVSNTNLSYDTALLSKSLQIQSPEGFTIDRKSFYRIEGHHGLDYKDVISDIRQFKKDNQLGFDLMALSLEQLRGNKEISKAYFTDYIKRHPGVEYLGGVKRGGTFIVVYESESNPSVIADFSLPYICCTPKSDVALSLPFDKICKDASPILFNITPSNGEVKANINNEQLNGGVQEINGVYRFNPANVSTQLLNQEIGFTVNDKPTNCFITVLSNLDVKVIVQNIIHPSDVERYTTVIFNVSNPNAGYEYKWDFLGNGVYISMVPDYQGNVEYKYLKVDESKPVNVMISANGCTQNISLKNWYYPEPIENTGPIIEDITADTTIAYAPEARVLLYGSIKLGNSSIASYVWTCASSNVQITVQGNSYTGLSVSVPGSYVVTLTVVDANNMTATKDVTVVVGTKARVTGVTISPQNPTTENEVIATAVVLNPDSITGLEYEWFLDGDSVGTTTSNSRSFGTLETGNGRKIEVNLKNSSNSNHLTDAASVVFDVAGRPVKGTSFSAKTMITMANGSQKEIEKIVPGEYLKSLKGTVQVRTVVNYTTNEPLYKLNEETYFITAPHPVLTVGDKWKSFKPEVTNAMISSIQVTMLQRGDRVVRENALEIGEELKEQIPLGDTTHVVYNIGVLGENGERNFFANRYCVYSEIEV